VKLAISLAALAATATLTLTGPALAAAPKLDIPDYPHLRDKATETVDVSIGGFLLGLARMFTREEAEHDPALKILHDVDSVKVRSYRFDSDTVYSKADIDRVRDQLKGPEWNAIAQVHKRDPQEDVDVYLCLEENGKTCGLAVISIEPREFTIVSISGSIDVDRIAELEGEFGIPGISKDQ
jgi:hypothetical protein